MRGFLVRWMVTAVAVLAAAKIVSGITYDGVGSLLIAALLLGLANAILKPLLMLVSLPLLLLTFGLFTLVINSFLLLMVGGGVVQGFSVAGWSSAFWGSLVISIVSILLRGFQGKSNIRVTTSRTPSQSVEPAAPSSVPPGKGRVIDV